MDHFFLFLMTVLAAGASDGAAKSARRAACWTVGPLKHLQVFSLSLFRPVGEPSSADGFCFQNSLTASMATGGNLPKLWKGVAKSFQKDPDRFGFLVPSVYFLLKSCKQQKPGSLGSPKKKQEPLTCPSSSQVRLLLTSLGVIAMLWLWASPLGSSSCSSFQRWASGFRGSEDFGGRDPGELCEVLHLKRIWCRVSLSYLVAFQYEWKDLIAWLIGLWWPALFWTFPNKKSMNS